MEGVVDHLMRQILSQINPLSLCVTEFVRVVDRLLPERVFYRLCPELYNQGYTLNRTPVRVQLLGQQPEVMAENALRAVTLGSHGIDLNFGCPSKIVNGNRGGAALLQYPEQIYQIIEAVRQAVPADQTVSAKIRLGWDSAEQSLDIAMAAEAAGADMLTVHGRTKMDGYRAEAINWQAIASIRQQLSIPVIANGEVWTPTDASQCLAVTECQHLMLGRGLLAMPNLAAAIAGGEQPFNWQQTQALLSHYCTLEMAGDKGLYFPNRIKQWLSYLRRHYQQADQLMRQIRTYRRAADITAALQS